MGHVRAPGHITAQHPEDRVKLTKAHYKTIPWDRIDELYSVPDSYFIHAHVRGRFKDALAGFSVINVIRDPRNQLTSRIVWDNRELCADVLEEYMLNTRGEPFCETYKDYAGWRGTAITMRYEDIPYDFARNNPASSTTIMPVENFHKDWTNDMHSVFVQHGGNELLQWAGY
ncbi:MAG: hypothetical protein P8Y47_12265 [Alphaproteobacteria bacterium]